MPAFVFLRRSDIEQQGGLLLAGILVVDLPKAAKENKRNMRLAEEIVQELTERAQSGVLGDELTVGWHGGHKPENFNRNDDVSLATWARGCLKITVRVGPRTRPPIGASSFWVRPVARGANLVRSRSA